MIIAETYPLQFQLAYALSFMLAITVSYALMHKYHCLHGDAYAKPCACEKPCALHFAGEVKELPGRFGGWSISICYAACRCQSFLSAIVVFIFSTGPLLSLSPSSFDGST